MELNEQEKERIVAEEKLRMETRKEFFKENFGGGPWRRGWGGGWRGHGCHSHRCGGMFFKVLILGLAVFGLCHLWHHSYCEAPGYSAAPAVSLPQAPAKN